jgi:hypothetical protein
LIATIIIRLHLKSCSWYYILFNPCLIFGFLIKKYKTLKSSNVKKIETLKSLDDEIIKNLPNVKTSKSSNPYI